MKLLLTVLEFIHRRDFYEYSSPVSSKTVERTAESLERSDPGLSLKAKRIGLAYV